MDEQRKKFLESGSVLTNISLSDWRPTMDKHPITKSYQYKHFSNKFKKLILSGRDPRTSLSYEPWDFKCLYGISPSDTKLTCCDFSADGMFLAIGGHEKRVVLYEVDNFKSTKMITKHTNVITDLRFSPKSTMFATSSLDRTVLLWDTTKSGYTAKLQGNNGPVFSLDFSEKVYNYMCICDSGEDLKFWAANSTPRLFHTMKACVQSGSKQVRFQTKADKLLAVASGKTINVIDHDYFQSVNKFQGEEEFRSICWTLCGNYIGSVTKNKAQFWSLVKRECIAELKSNGEEFVSCCIHPRFNSSSVMMIGCSKSVIYWNPPVPLDLFKYTFDDHTDVVSCLTSCLTTNMIASTSHDHTVKLWY